MFLSDSDEDANSGDETNVDDNKGSSSNDGITLTTSEKYHEYGQHRNATWQGRRWGQTSRREFLELNDEEGLDNNDQDHIIEEEEVDVSAEVVEEDTWLRLRSGARYRLRRLTKPVNSQRDRFEHEFSGANMSLRSG